MSNAELVARFQSLAILHFQASRDGNSEVANDCVNNLNDIVRRLWQDNGKTKDALKDLALLAKSDNPAVAIKAITYTLEVFPEVAEELPRLTREDSLVSLGAEYTLKRWKRGEQSILKEVLGEANL